MRPKLWGREDGEEEIGQRGGEGRRDGAESRCAVGGERRTGGWGLAWCLGSWQCSNNLFVQKGHQQTHPARQDAMEGAQEHCGRGRQHTHFRKGQELIQGHIHSSSRGAHTHRRHSRARPCAG